MRNRFLTDQIYGAPPSGGRKARYKAKLAATKSRFGWVDDFHASVASFRCAHCGRNVAMDPLLSGVNNRNHCPYCLWSKHLDHRQPGDRLSACKAPMQPVGLAVKRAHKKYGSDRDGELMLVHTCLDCGRVSANRVAADDDVELLLDRIGGSTILDRYARVELEAAGILLLGPYDLPLARARLLGKT